jgi:hypothetical protein
LKYLDITPSVRQNSFPWLSHIAVADRFALHAAPSLKAVSFTFNQTTMTVAVKTDTVMTLQPKWTLSGTTTGEKQDMEQNPHVDLLYSDLEQLSSATTAAASSDAKKATASAVAVTTLPAIDVTLIGWQRNCCARVLNYPRLDN